MGKTTLANLLRQRLPLAAGFEQHAERPFQGRFSRDLPRWALANQVDYMLLRAEQEITIRQNPGTGIQDGGLEQDFWVFTRLFYRRGYIDEAEYRLCERLYTDLRLLLPFPDLIVALNAPLPLVAERYARRSRPLEIATLADLAEIQALLDDWLAGDLPSPALTIDASSDDPDYSACLPLLLDRISNL